MNGCQLHKKNVYFIKKYIHVQKWVHIIISLFSEPCTQSRLIDRCTHKAGRPTHKADRPTHMHTQGRLTNTHAHTRMADRHTCTHKADRLTHMHTQGRPTDTHAHTRQTDRHMHTQGRPTDTHAHTRQTDRHTCTHNRIGTSGKIVWKLRNVRKLSGVLNVLEILSGNLMKILYNPVFY